MPRAFEYKVDIPDLADLVAQGWSSGEIGRKYGVNYKLVLRRIQQHKIPYEIKRSGRHNGSWNGGRRQVGRYIYIYCPDHPFATKVGCVLEHRLMMEQKLGRYLMPGEVVHHKRGWKNHPDNLELFESNAAHLAATLKGKIPKWTADGMRRISEGVRQYHKRKREANHAKSKARASR